MIQSTLTARQLFRLRFPNGGKNFMTPEVMKLCKISKAVAVELSTGTGFQNDRIYGVTTVCMKPDGTVRKGKGGVGGSCQCFSSRALAERHINRMAGILKGGR